MCKTHVKESIILSWLFEFLNLYILQFLSMKLATVNPELNVNLERILSRDVSEGGLDSF